MSNPFKGFRFQRGATTYSRAADGPELGGNEPILMVTRCFRFVEWIVNGLSHFTVLGEVAVQRHLYG